MVSALLIAATVIATQNFTLYKEKQRQEAEKQQVEQVQKEEKKEEKLK